MHHIRVMQIAYLFNLTTKRNHKRHGWILHTNLVVSNEKPPARRISSWEKEKRFKRVFYNSETKKPRCISEAFKGDACNISSHSPNGLSDTYETICNISSHKIASKVCIFDQLLKLNVVKLLHYNQSLWKQMALGSTMLLLSDYGEVWNLKAYSTPR